MSHNFRKNFYPKSIRSSHSYNRSSTSSSKGKELILELGEDLTLRIKFEGFFDNDIKEKIKSIPNAKYD